MSNRRRPRPAAAAAVLTLVVGSGLMLGAPAAFATPTYPPTASAITVSAGVVAPGQSVTISGSGFLPGSGVTATWTGPGAHGSSALGVRFGSRALTADMAGLVSTSITFTAVGTHTVSLSGLAADGSPLSVSTDVVVRDVVAAGADDDPTATGTPLALYVGGALVLLAAGAGAVTVVRRRRSAAQAAPVETSVPQHASR